jgi:hypothetical protein
VKCLSIPVIASQRMGGLRELWQRRAGVATPSGADGVPVPA